MFIENVGNLVCPAAFDLGEAHKVVLLSTTEGEDKPAKYPDMFAAADLMLLNKSDLLPHLDFDVGACIGHALRVNPHLQTLVVSAKTGEGMAAFYAWVEARAGARAAERRADGGWPRPGRQSEVTRLRLRLRGAVQGVGFRPFAYGLRRAYWLAGFVRNDAEGVMLEVEGARPDAFVEALRGSCRRWRGSTRWRSSASPRAASAASSSSRREAARRAREFPRTPRPATPASTTCSIPTAVFISIPSSTAPIAARATR